jgi:hypothetical protein
MKMPNLEFDEATHTYLLYENEVDRLSGRKLVSVTQVLPDDKRRVDPWYLERGRLIHLATALFDHDELDEDSIDERIKPYLDAYVKFKKETGFEPKHIELPLYHPKYYYAGTIDRIGLLNNSQDLIDLKTGGKAKADELQLAAYWELCRASYIKIRRVFDLYLHENGTYSLTPPETQPKLLLPVFLASLTVARWKEKP